MDIQSVIAAFKPYFPQKIILFGSRVHGDARADSDWDIALIKDTTEPYHDRVIAARRLLRTTVPVDVFVFTQQEVQEKMTTNPLIREIMTTGKVIYG